VPVDYVPAQTLDSVGTTFVPAFTSGRILPSTQPSPLVTLTTNIPIELNSILEYDKGIRNISVPRWWTDAVDR
jgi:hypothetical protein